ncbi:MAG TPA: hypothetical protein VGL09_17740 [Methylomirabilota bacterium]|jgi:hypothetical protein
MAMRTLAWCLPLLVLLSGCSMIRAVLGMPTAHDPSVTIKPAETRWLLVQNPRFGDVPSEPEYIWVEEDKVPTTFKTLIRGKRAILAPPEIVARYGAPPGGGKISPRQGVPAPASAEAPRTEKVTRNGAPPVPAGANATTVSLNTAPPEMPRRGYVVHVDTTRIAVDLTASDGLHMGSIVSIRRDKTPVVHPVTGELLGELDEEVATARITEIREKFSVAEIQSVSPGARIEVRDRVVPK